MLVCIHNGKSLHIAVAEPRAEGGVLCVLKRAVKCYKTNPSYNDFAFALNSFEWSIIIMCGPILWWLLRYLYQSDLKCFIALYSVS